MSPSSRFAWIDSAGRFGVTPLTQSIPWGYALDVEFRLHSLDPDTEDLFYGEES